ncbi:ATP-binding cassette domain-containing protein [Globicatella sanguinis]
MILLQVNDLARRFADETLYENVNFSIQTRDRIALVGRNGTGKSTLIKQIMNQEPISSGTISKAKGLKIGYLEQHVAIDSKRTIWEEMLHTFEATLKLRDEAQEAADRLAQLADHHDSTEYQEALHQYDQLLETLNNKNAYAIESEIRTVLHGFRFFEEDYQTPVQALSGGQKTRLALAQILLMDYDLLILDEPTNHLDMEMLAWLEQYLVGYKGALLIVFHDRYFLDKITNQVIELRNHTAHLYKGNYSYYTWIVKLS